MLSRPKAQNPTHHLSSILDSQGPGFWVFSAQSLPFRRRFNMILRMRVSTRTYRLAVVKGIY